MSSVSSGLLPSGSGSWDSGPALSIKTFWDGQTEKRAPDYSELALPGENPECTAAEGPSERSPEQAPLLQLQRLLEGLLIGPQTERWQLGLLLAPGPGCLPAGKCDPMNR